MNELWNDFRDSSAGRVLLILFLGIIWSNLLRIDFEDFKMPHFFVVFAMFVCALILGEGIRWFLNPSSKGKPIERSDIKLSEEEQAEEYSALNYGILVGVSLIVLTILHMLF